MERDYPVVVNLTSAALPAAGAWTAQAYTALPYDTRQGFARRLSMIVNYAKDAGATVGQVKLRPLWTINGVADVAHGVLDTAITPAAPRGQFQCYEASIIGPQYTVTITSGVFVLNIEVPPYATHCKVLACEVGDTAHPGVCQVRLAATSAL